MAPSSSATAEIRFVLDTIARIHDLAQHDRFADARDDVVDAVLEGAGEFSAGVWGPINGIGDTVGARWTDDGVVMPDGCFRISGLCRGRMGDHRRSYRTWRPGNAFRAADRRA